MLEIKGREVGKIKTISTDNPYKVDADHTFNGQFYNLYQFNGIAFTVNSNDEFVALKNSGKLYSVDFVEGNREKEIEGQMVNVKTLQLASCTSVDFEVTMANTENTLRKIYKDEEVTVVSDSLINSLTA